MLAGKFANRLSREMEGQTDREMILYVDQRCVT